MTWFSPPRIHVQLVCSVFVGSSCLDLPLEESVPTTQGALGRPGDRRADGGAGSLPFERSLMLVDSSQWETTSTLLLSRRGRLRVGEQSAGALVLAQWQTATSGGRPTGWRPPRLGSMVASWADPAIRREQAVWTGLSTRPVFYEEPRPPAPAVPEGQLSLAAFNLGNYFLTLGARGAQSVGEQRAQTARLAATFHAMPVDVWAVVEVERGGGALDALADAVNALDPGSDYTARQPEGCLGGDAIEAGLLYRSARVRPVGQARWLPNGSWRRCPLVQQFVVDGVQWALVVVHFTSRRCAGRLRLVRPGPAVAEVPSCGEAQRSREATALATWVSEFRAANPDVAVLVAGDFNGVRRERAAELLRAAGLMDSMPSGEGREGGSRYSYAFAGQVSLLDGVMATEPMASRLTGAGVWHSNADEPPHDRRAMGASSPSGDEVVFQAPQPWRSSDHDPVWATFEPR